jgi:AcrR family transcriptional regulator
VAPDNERRAEILDASLKVFLRYGLKKTSMDEVARAAGLSRPGLYLHFSTKEELFASTVAWFLDRTLISARGALATGDPLPDRVVACFLAMDGPFVGDRGAHAAELIEAARQVAGEDIHNYRLAFLTALGRALTGAPLRGLPPEAVAHLLELVSAGAKHRAATLDDYRREMRFAADAFLTDVLCTP